MPELQTNPFLKEENPFLKVTGEENPFLKKGLVSRAAEFSKGLLKDITTPTEEPEDYVENPFMPQTQEYLREREERIKGEPRISTLPQETTGEKIAKFVEGAIPFGRQIRGEVEWLTPETMMEVPAMIAGGALIGAIGSGIAGPIAKSTWFRMLTNKERGLVVQTISDMQKAGVSEAKILRSVNDPAFRQKAFEVRGATTTRGTPEPAEIKPSEVKPIQKPSEVMKVEPKPEAKIEKPSSGFQRFMDKLGYRLASEQKGQAFLDDMIEKGITPQNVNSLFWEKTYPKLNDEQKSFIHKYIQSLTSMKPGSILETDAEGKTIIAKNWMDIGKDLDLGNSAEFLEGTERGYVAIIRAANEKHIKPEAKVEVAKPISETVYHAKTKGDFKDGKLSVDIGSDADIMGKGFYFGSKDYVSKYGTPEQYSIQGKFATNEQWVSTLKKYSDKTIQEQRRLSREELKSQGYVGVKTKDVGVVWDKEAIKPESIQAAIKEEVDKVQPGLFKKPFLGEAGFIRIGKEPGPKFEGDASKVEEMFGRAKKASEEIHKTDLTRIYHQVKTAMVDVSGNLKKTLLTMRGRQRGKLNPAEEVVMRHELIAGANPKASYLYNEVFKGIFRDLSELEQTYLDRMIQARRTIEIESYKPEVKHPEELGTKELQEWLDQIPKELKAKLDVQADLYFKEMRTQGIDQLLAEKIITQEQYDGLAEHIYSPRQFLQHIDPERTYSIAGKKITVPDSGIKALEEGSYGLLENDSRLLLSQVITRTQTRIFRNRANRALYDLAKDIPDNEVVKLAKVIKTTKEGKPVYEPTPTGFDKIKVMIDGTPREMLMPSEMAVEWITRDPLLGQTTASVIRWLSGSAILKPMATGINPEFALTNVPRDIVHIWLTDYRATYSKTLPIFFGQMGKDLKAVTKDGLLRKGRWVDYIKEGGGMEFLTHQGWFKKEGLSQQSQDLQKVFGYLGESSEIVTRLALRERAIKEGYTPEQAAWLARNYLDFSQGGNFIKAVDTGVPYLNAAFQATRGVFRAAALNPALFTWKIAQFGAVVIGLFYLNRFTNPEAWENISAKEKAGNFILPTPFRFKDKEGNKRMVYFRIPKDQTIRPILSAFEAMAAKVIGDKVNTDEITHAVQEFSPVGPSQVLPPTFDAFLGYVSNKDFWRNEDIWKGPEIKAEEEYTKYTHPLFIKAGQLTGLSPERLRYALEQYFTYGNIYTSVGSYAWKVILDELPEEERQMVTEELILKQPFVRRFARTTQPTHALIKETEKTKIEANTERYKLTRKFDLLSQRFYDKEISKEEIDSFLKELPIEEKVRLKRRHFRLGKIQELPEKRWWLELAETPSEARALIYWNRWRVAAEEEKTILEKNRLRVPGIMSGSFIKRLNELKKKE